MNSLNGMAPAARPPQFYSVAQVAQILGMSSMSLYRAIASGQFPAVRIRGRLIVPARAIEAMAEAAIEEQTVVDAAAWVPDVTATSAFRANPTEA